MDALKVEEARVHQINEVVDQKKTREDTKVQEVVDAPEKNRRRPRVSYQVGEPTNPTANKRYTREKRDYGELEELQELTLVSLNIRGFNREEKHWAISDLIHENEVHVVCLNETKLTIPVYLDNYWSHQTMLQRNGGCWTAATNKVRMTLVKALGTYLCWMRFTTRRHTKCR